MKPTIFLLMNSLDIQRGGLTKASLKQAATFTELGYDTHMVTFNFNPKYPLILNELQKMGRLHKNVNVHNLYNDLSNFNVFMTKYSSPKVVDPVQMLAGKSFDKRKGHNAFRIYNNGVYTEYISINKKYNHIEFIDYFNENRHRITRETFDLQGDLCRTSHMDMQFNKPRQIVHYNKAGKAYLTQWNNPKTNKPIRTIIFGRDGSVKKVFVKNSKLELNVFWLNDLINKIATEKAIVISDTRSTDETLVNLKNKKAKKVWRLHSSFLGAPYTLDADISNPVKIGLKNINKFDAAIVLTDEQKNDMINRFGDLPNLHVIPHFHKTSKKTIPSFFQKKDKKCAIVVSRLSTLKRIDHVIRAFKIVNEALPDVYLEIYGIGNEHDNLKKLIEKLKLTDTIKLHGYIKNPDKAYRHSLFSILTSKQEGFALSILESMSNRTPVVSYDVKYGPNDMIIHNETGKIVKNGNIEQLAEEMIHLFNHPNETIKLGINAHDHVNKTFNEKTYRKKWISLFNHLTK